MTKEYDNQIAEATATLAKLSSQQLPNGTTVLFLWHNIQVFLQDGTRVVFNVDVAFADEESK